MMDALDRMKANDAEWATNLATQALYSALKEKTDEIERLRWALKRISICEGGDVTVIWKEMRDIAIEALQQKDSE